MKLFDEHQEIDINVRDDESIKMHQTIMKEETIVESRSLNDSDRMITNTIALENDALCECRCCRDCQNRCIDTSNQCRLMKNKKTYDNEIATSSSLNHYNLVNHIYHSRETAPQNQVFENYCSKYSSSHHRQKLVALQDIRKSCSAKSSMRKLLTLLIVNSILSQLEQLNLHNEAQPDNIGHSLYPPSILPNIFVDAQEISITNDYCNSDYDCRDGERFCHEKKCICPRDRPVEDKERAMCLALALINEVCYTDNQCLSDAKCIDGICACGPDFISLYNPSTKVFYCHPKRRLNEDCNHDNQCPENAFCSIKKHGCLCQNGYGASILKKDGIESLECLPKTCSQTSDCESEYHTCDDNKCKCLATHFDPHSAACYKFASIGGQSDGSGDQLSNQTIARENIESSKDSDNFIDSILNDLKNGDSLWPILVALIVSAIILLACMVFLVRRYCLGYCWNTHKKEYEPNNNTRSGQPFNKNSINNKSFRQKKGEIDDDEDENNQADGDDCESATADGSNLVVTSSCKKNGTKQTIGKTSSRSPFKTNGSKTAGGGTADNRYVRVDMSNAYSNGEDDQSQSQTNGHHYQPFHQVLEQPLASSTSTPV